MQVSYIFVSEVLISVSEFFIEIRLATGNYSTFPVSLLGGWMTRGLV